MPPSPFSSDNMFLWNGQVRKRGLNFLVEKGTCFDSETRLVQCYWIGISVTGLPVNPFHIFCTWFFFYLFFSSCQWLPGSLIEPCPSYFWVSCDLEIVFSSEYIKLKQITGVNPLEESFPFICTRPWSLIKIHIWIIWNKPKPPKPLKVPFPFLKTKLLCYGMGKILKRWLESNPIKYL